VFKHHRLSKPFWPKKGFSRFSRCAAPLGLRRQCPRICIILRPSVLLRPPRFQQNRPLRVLFMRKRQKGSRRSEPPSVIFHDEFHACFFANAPATEVLTDEKKRGPQWSAPPSVIFHQEPHGRPESNEPLSVIFHEPFLSRASCAL
jgi:hypothetical protein